MSKFTDPALPAGPGWDERFNEAYMLWDRARRAIARAHKNQRDGFARSWRIEAGNAIEDLARALRIYDAVCDAWAATPQSPFDARRPE